MALGDPYISLEQLKSYLKITDTTDDSELTDALQSVSRGIEEVCDRQFNDAGSATSRVFDVTNASVVRLDDFHTIVGLVVKTDDGDTGTYGTTWASTDYQLKPLNGIVAGQTGWPYWRIHAVGSRSFPCNAKRPALEVTARWGWASVPTPVRQACLLSAAETFKMKDAPFGVAGFGDFGVVRVRSNPMVMQKLAPYMRDVARVG